MTVPNIMSKAFFYLDFCRKGGGDALCVPPGHDQAKILQGRVADRVKIFSSLVYHVFWKDKVNFSQNMFLNMFPDCF